MTAEIEDFYKIAPADIATNEKNYLVIGNDKGNDIDSRVKNNFGMAKPEGYRKAQRLYSLADKFNIPVVTTLMGRGAFPDGDELCLGMPGMHGNYTATTSIQNADLLIAIGVRFDDRVTANPKFFAQNAKVIHADIDPAEIGKVRDAEVPIVGDAKSVIKGLIEKLESTELETSGWIKEINDMKESFPLNYNQEDKGPLKVPYVLEELQKMSDDDSIVVSGVGQHQMWISQHWKFTKPNTWLNSGGLGTMGYSLPAAIGAKAAFPDRPVLGLDGDGGFQMNIQELGTIFQTKTAVKIVVLNNEFLGMVRQWQQLFFDKRYASTEMINPDFVSIAKAYHIDAQSVSKREDLDGAVQAMIASEKPYFLEVCVEKEDNVFPMIPSGASVSDIRLE